jgi:uncharacterized DUF497 family protein
VVKLLKRGSSMESDTMEFEWDYEKELENIRKHHINFTVAKKIFSDENRIEIYDKKHSIDEDRYNTIGAVDDILFVVYTERHDKVRLISARLASEKERRLYYDSNSFIV